MALEVVKTQIVVYEYPFAPARKVPLKSKKKKANIPIYSPISAEKELSFFHVILLEFAFEFYVIVLEFEFEFHVEFAVESRVI